MVSGVLVCSVVPVNGTLVVKCSVVVVSDRTGLVKVLVVSKDGDPVLEEANGTAERKHDH